MMPYVGIKQLKKSSQKSYFLRFHTKFDGEIRKADAFYHRICIKSKALHIVMNYSFNINFIILCWKIIERSNLALLSEG